jgi:acyl carrier protein
MTRVNRNPEGGRKAAMKGIREAVRTFILENFLFGDDDCLRDDISLVEEGIVDSTGVLELVTFVEEKFAIVVQDDEIIPENFDSILKMENYLEGKLSELQTAKLRPAFAS